MPGTLVHLERVRLEVARGLEHLLQRLPGAPLQPDPQSGPNSGVTSARNGFWDRGPGMCGGRQPYADQISHVRR
jgi:hypothetical protein